MKMIRDKSITTVKKKQKYTKLNNYQPRKKNSEKRPK